MRRFRDIFYREEVANDPEPTVFAPDTVQCDVNVYPNQFATFVDCLGDEAVLTVRDGRAIVTLRVTPRATLVIQTDVREFLDDDRSSDRDLADDVRRALRKRNICSSP